MTLRSQISISIITNLDVSHLPTQNITVLAVNNKSEYYLWLIVSEMFRSKINFQFGNIPTPTEHIVDVQKAQTMFCFLWWTEVSPVWQSNTREHWRQRIRLTARLSLDKTSNINHHQLCEAPAQLIRWHEFYMRFDITEPAPDLDTNWYQLILRLIQVWQKNHSAGLFLWQATRDAGCDFLCFSRWKFRSVRENESVFVVDFKLIISKSVKVVTTFAWGSRNMC